MFKRFLNWLLPRPEPNHRSDQVRSARGRIRLLPNSEIMLAKDLVFTSVPVWHNNWLYRYDGTVTIHHLVGSTKELLKLFTPGPKLLYVELPLTKSLQPAARWCLLQAQLIKTLCHYDGKTDGITVVVDVVIEYEGMVPDDHADSYLLESKEELCADQVG